MIHKDQRYRRAKEQKAKDKMQEASTHSHKGWYGYYYQNGHWAKMYRGKRSKWLKRQSNKAIRRDKDFVGSNGDYKKKYDYWWELL